MTDAVCIVVTVVVAGLAVLVGLLVLREASRRGSSQPTAVGLHIYVYYLKCIRSGAEDGGSSGGSHNEREGEGWWSEQESEEKVRPYAREM